MSTYYKNYIKKKFHKSNVITVDYSINCHYKTATDMAIQKY
jgi:hypothetical protein